MEGKDSFYNRKKSAKLTTKKCNCSTVYKNVLKIIKLNL